MAEAQEERNRKAQERRIRIVPEETIAIADVGESLNQVAVHILNAKDNLHKLAETPENAKVGVEIEKIGKRVTRLLEKISKQDERVAAKAEKQTTRREKLLAQQKKIKEHLDKLS